MGTVTETIISIIAEKALLQPADIDVSMTLTELGLDSLGLVEAIFSIEESFDIQIPFNANDAARNSFDVSTVGSIINAVQGLVAQKAA